MTKLFDKFDKRMSEMESQLKSLTVNTQPQGLGNILHNRYLRFKKCKEKNLRHFWHCFKYCAEGHTEPFCTGKQGKLNSPGLGIIQRRNVVVPHSVLRKNSKSGINEDLPHSCKYDNSSDVYTSCKYDDSNIVDV